MNESPSLNEQRRRNSRTGRADVGNTNSTTYHQHICAMPSSFSIMRASDVPTRVWKKKMDGTKRFKIAQSFLWPTQKWFSTRTFYGKKSRDFTLKI